MAKDEWYILDDDLIKAILTVQPTSKLEYLKPYIKQVAIYRRALELMAISYFGNNECIRFVNTGFQAESDVCLIEYFLDQAKKELEETI